MDASQICSKKVIGWARNRLRTQYFKPICLLSWHYETSSSSIHTNCAQRAFDFVKNTTRQADICIGWKVPNGCEPLITGIVYGKNLPENRFFFPSHGGFPVMFFLTPRHFERSTRSLQTKEQFILNSWHAVSSRFMPYDQFCEWDCELNMLWFLIGTIDMFASSSFTQNTPKWPNM